MCRDPVPASAVSGRDLALALACEMRSLRDLSERLPLAAGLDCDAIIASQDQDLLAQTLDELASFLERGADGFGSEPVWAFGPALERIRLAALASRLSGRGAPAAEAEGELELL